MNQKIYFIFFKVSKSKCNIRRLIFVTTGVDVINTAYQYASIINDHSVPELSTINVDQLNQYDIKH